MKTLIISILLYCSLFSKDYLVEYSKRYDVNSTQIYNNYIQANKKALKQYKDDISKVWKDVKVSNNLVWVEYTNNYKFRKIIDYKKGKLIFEVFAKDDKLAHEYIVNMFKNLYKYDIEDIYKNSILRKKIYKILNIYEEIVLPKQAFISNIIDIAIKNDIIQKLLLEEYTKRIYNKKDIYKIEINLPKKYKEVLKKEYTNIINDISKELNIPKNIILAIIKNNSMFNPISINDKPSYGLMQLDLKRAMESYYKLYGYDKFISALQLFDPYKNILYSTRYLKILFDDTFKDIKDKKSKLYCVILAYKTDIQTVLNIFKNKDAIKNINSKNSSLVYRQIIKKLKNRYDRIYMNKIIKDLKNVYKK